MYVIKFSGHFGFIKPYGAERNEEMKSENFLTPSNIEGIRQFLDISKICRYRLNHTGISWQQETTSSKKVYHKHKNKLECKTSILNRGILLYPELYIMVPTIEDAEQASIQHITLTRREDIMIPSKFNGKIINEITEEEFDNISGWELIPSDQNQKDSISVGVNRFANAEKMYGILKIFGTPTVFETYVEDYK